MAGEMPGVVRGTALAVLRMQGIAAIVMMMAGIHVCHAG